MVSVMSPTLHNVFTMAQESLLSPLIAIIVSPGRIFFSGHFSFHAAMLPETLIADIRSDPRSFRRMAAPNGTPSSLDMSTLNVKVELFSTRCTAASLRHRSRQIHITKEVSHFKLVCTSQAKTLERDTQQDSLEQR
jgi:hypothetical protein